MIVGFRVDASAVIGAGHFMRCLTLANFLRDLGARTLFLSKLPPEFVTTTLIDNRHELLRVEQCKDLSLSRGAGSNAWLEGTQGQDAAETQKCLGELNLDWLVVDHYGLDIEWQQLLNNRAENLLVIDDLANRQHRADLLVDQNFYFDMSSRYAGLVPSECTQFLGPHYALLRPEFRSFNAKPDNSPLKETRIVVSLGGADAEDITGRVVEALSNLDRDAIHIDVIVGALYPQFDRLEKRCRQLGFVLHRQVSNMAEMLGNCDLAIGAGGASSWERCCLGVASVTLILADNQRQLANDLAKLGLTVSLDTESLSEDQLLNSISDLLNDDELQQSQRQSCLRLVDGKGVHRVVSKMLQENLSVVPAESNDSMTILAWRNNEAVRQMSFSQEIIEATSHLEWFEASLSNPARHILIGRAGELELGCVRFDVDSGQATVSIFLNPLFLGLGIGGKLLASAECWLKGFDSSVYCFKASVQQENEASKSLFLHASYTWEKSMFMKTVGAA